MDNLTHSLVGWALGQAGLKNLSGLAAPTLVIAANIPDIDAAASVLGVQSLALRRGLTHGPMALLILPLILTGAMLWFDRWQSDQGQRPAARRPVRAGPLLLLAFIGSLTHPALDYLNNYGIRLLEPFSSTWFYGDTLFIIDVWLLLILPIGIGLSRRRERAGMASFAIPAQIALLVGAGYIGANGWIARSAEAQTAEVFEGQFGHQPELVIANAVPVEFWRREMIWQDSGLVGWGNFNLLAADVLSLQKPPNEVPIKIEIAKQARRINPDADAFLFWARTPYASLEETGADKIIVLRDARFANPWVIDRFTVITPIKD